MGGSEFAKITPQSEWSMGTKMYYSLLQFTSLGREFVIFFFVLSGFSIAHSLSGKNKNIGSFYLRRVIRLYPPYILALIWAAVIFFLLKKFAHQDILPGATSVFHSVKSTLSNLIYIPEGALIPQFWSLTHEVIFYIIMPLFLFINIRHYIWASLLIYLAGLFLLPPGSNTSSIMAAYFLEYNIFFAAGVFLYMNYEKIKSVVVLKRMFFLVVSIALFVLTVVVKFKTGEDSRVTLILAMILSVLMIVNFLHYSLSNPVLRFLGAMSYTIYIVHFAAIYLFVLLLDLYGIHEHNQITEWYIWPIAVIFCILIAIPLYYAAEYPTKKWISKLRN